MTELDAPASGWELLVTVASLLIAIEIGYRLGRRRRDATLEARKSQADLLVLTLLGLLSLLLAFSFSMVATRFDQRKALVLDDANAIRTTYLRATPLPAPHGARLQGLLRTYIEVRVRATTPAELEAAIVRSGSMHNELWAEATAVAHANPGSEIVALFLDSLNRLIDLHEARVTVALFQRLPPAILWMLLVVSALAIGMAGFRSGLDRTRSVIPMCALVATVVAVLALIVELDRPASRMFEISQHAMQDVRKAMAHRQISDR